MKARKSDFYADRMSKIAQETDYLIKISKAQSAKAFERVKQEKKDYHNEAWKLTRWQPIYLLPNFDKRGSDYHLDHIISIYDGHKHSIPLNIIANFKNLRIIPAKENMCKGRKSLPERLHQVLQHLKHLKELDRKANTNTLAPFVRPDDQYLPIQKTEQFEYELKRRSKSKDTFGPFTMVDGNSYQETYCKYCKAKTLMNIKDLPKDIQARIQPLPKPKPAWAIMAEERIAARYKAQKTS